MSNPKIILPATGGGLFIAGWFFNRFFLGIAAILLGLTIWKIFHNLRGERRG